MDDEIQRAWSEHGDQPDFVAARLPTLAAAAATPAHASALTRLILHFMGEERQQWAEAAALCAQTLSGVPREAGLAPAEADLAVACFLAGDLDGGLSAEARAAALDGPNALAHLARARLGVARARFAQAPESVELISAALDFAALIAAKSPADRALAIATNNLASGLLERERGPELDRVLQRSADLSHHFWLRAGTWIHEERALYLLALTARALGQPAAAVAHAARALVIIAENGDEPVDVAFLCLVQAAAHRDLGETAEAASALARADALASEFQESWLKNWYSDERTKAFPEG